LKVTVEKGKEPACWVLLLQLAGLLFWLFSCSEKESFQYISPQGNQFIILHNSPPEVPVFYTTEINSRRIDFFVIRIEGETRVFLNRCRRCFNSGLGFRFEDKYIRCRTCNVTYPVREVLKGIGSCYPIPVKARVEGRYCYINTEDLLEAYK
jgi:hypothetical protein